MILNSAQGNGRFSDADQARFLGTAQESAIKLAARLDLCATQGLLPPDAIAAWKALLQSVSVMTSSMIAGIQRCQPTKLATKKNHPKIPEGPEEENR
jgi:four helix bundle protein